jgi:hypothetical protein
MFSSSGKSRPVKRARPCGSAELADDGHGQDGVDRVDVHGLVRRNGQRGPGQRPHWRMEQATKLRFISQAQPKNTLVTPHTQKAEMFYYYLYKYVYGYVCMSLTCKSTGRHLYVLCAV